MGAFPPDDWTICCAMVYIAWAWKKTGLARYMTNANKIRLGLTKFLMCSGSDFQ